MCKRCRFAEHRVCACVCTCVCVNMCVYTGVYVHVCTLRHGMGGGWTMSGGFLASKEQVTAMEAHHLLSVPDVHSPAAPGGHQGLSHPMPTVSQGLRCCCALRDGDREWGQAGTVAGTATPLPTRSLLCLAPFASLSLRGGCPRGSVTARSLPAIPTAPCCEATCLRVAGGVPTAPGVSPGLAAA